jgi:hypothetical protein
MEPTLRTPIRSAEALVMTLECRFNVNVVVPRASIEERLPGGMDAYAAKAVNFAADENLTCVGFPPGFDFSGDLVTLLESIGLVGGRDGAFVDYAVLSPFGLMFQREPGSGSSRPFRCDWLTLGPYRLCWLSGTEPTEVRSQRAQSGRPPHEYYRASPDVAAFLGADAAAWFRPGSAWTGQSSDLDSQDTVRGQEGRTHPEHSIVAVGTPARFRDEVAQALGVDADAIGWLQSTEAVGVFLEGAHSPVDVFVLSPQVHELSALALGPFVRRYSPDTNLIVVRDSVSSDFRDKAVQAGIRDVVAATAGASALHHSIQLTLDAPAQGVLQDSGASDSDDSRTASHRRKPIFSSGKARLLKHMMDAHGLWRGVKGAPNLDIRTLGVWHLRDHLGDQVGFRFIGDDYRVCTACGGIGHLQVANFPICDSCSGSGRLSTLSHQHSREVWDYVTSPEQYQELKSGGDVVDVPTKFEIADHLVRDHGYQASQIEEPVWDENDPMAILPTGHTTLEWERFGWSAAFQHETLHIVGPQAQTNGPYERVWRPHTHGGAISGERPYEPSGRLPLRS